MDTFQLLLTIVGLITLAVLGYLILAGPGPGQGCGAAAGRGALSPFGKHAGQG